jgi:hypothetical protein
MTTINPETQIVASRYDAQNRICFYTYQHSDGSRYTVEVPIDQLHRTGNVSNNREQRRRHLAMKILNHIQTNPPDKVDGPAA